MGNSPTKKKDHGLDAELMSVWELAPIADWDNMPVMDWTPIPDWEPLPVWESWTTLDDDA